MNKELKNLAMVDVAFELIKENKGPISIQELFKQISIIKEISLEDVEKLTTLYMNIIQSGRFIYVGDDMWDLKDGNLELWDNDGSQFIEIIEEEDEEELDDIILEDEEDEEEVIELEEDEEELDEETKQEILEGKEYLEVELPLHVSDEDEDVEFDADDYDEDD